jgi:aminocarboxymuconate-semialdehyde decarboxylase
MLTIDMHAHVLPRTWPNLKEKYGYGGFINLEHIANGNARMLMDGRFFREIEPNCWDAETRLEDCEKFGVDVQVLSTVPVMFSYWAKPEHTLDLAMLLNDHIAGMVNDYPTRFIGLGTVPMQHVDSAIKEMERLKKIGIPGIQIGSHINDFNLNASEFDAFYSAAEELDISIMVHPWDMMGKERMPDYWLPWLVGMPAETCLAICSMIFGGVLERFPNLKVLFAHGGGSFPATLGRIEHGFNVRPDLCAKDNDKGPREYLDKFYIDSIVHDENMLRYVLDLMGPKQIALGSDYPFPLGELEPGKLIKSTELDEATKAQLLHQTALDWLGLDKAQYEGK